jgi:hypothetical protein
MTSFEHASERQVAVLAHDSTVVTIVSLDVLVSRSVKAF